ncbi:hypothetical protein BJ508DRAFT_331609 [Ascobolus immersus RN42]|uniref:Uncharacterized protein n=1 Tax=Ascobolus immersus RN42 TaxID=1160509 RepID=A0A3N4HQ02_ASCIM|nr:hypothetical protein BJ508DRAFT_331609 [Ascobolus immersus RN42]
MAPTPPKPELSKKRPASPAHSSSSRPTSSPSVQPKPKRPRQTKLTPSVQVQVQKKASPGASELAEALLQLPKDKVMNLLSMVEQMKRPVEEQVAAISEGPSENEDDDASQNNDATEPDNAEGNNDAALEWHASDDEFQGSQEEEPEVPVKEEKEDVASLLPSPEARRKPAPVVATSKPKVTRTPARPSRSRQPKAIRINAEIVQSLMLNLSRVPAKFGGEEVDEVFGQINDMVVQRLSLSKGSRASDPLGVDDDDDEDASEVEETVKAPKKRRPVGSLSLVAIRAVLLTETDILAMPWRTTWSTTKIASYDPVNKFSDSAKGGLVRARDGELGGDVCDRCVAGDNCPFDGCLFLDSDDIRCANCAWNGKPCTFENL